MTKLDAIRRLNDFAIQQMSRGGNVVIMVDEAQNFDDRTIEGFRLLSNLESGNHKMIQVVLSGQPELNAKLDTEKMQQFVQRISLKRYILPLDKKDIYIYIQHRLKIAKYEGDSLFSRRALQLISEYSQGIPRKINVLCDNALLTAYAMGKKRIKASIVEETINEFTQNPYSGNGHKRRLRFS